MTGSFGPVGISGSMFQSAKQITGFPKYGRNCFATLRRCFNLPSRLLASPRILGRILRASKTGINLPSRLLASPSRLRATAHSLYFAPRFNLPSRLLASPRLRRIGTKTEGSARFQSAKQITGFPKRPIDRRCCCACRVSICQADYWLPQARSAWGLHRCN